MKIEIRQGTVEDVLTVEAQIPELPSNVAVANL